MPSPTLFISYSSRSQSSVDLAHELAYALRNDGYEVFLDKDDLPAGESFDDRIARAIVRSDGFIFLASPEALQPGAYTLTELGHAKRTWRSGRGRILPVVLDNAAMDRLDPYLRVLNVLRPVGNPRAEVLDQVQRLWPMPAAPTPAPPPRYPSLRRTLLLAGTGAAILCVGGVVVMRQSGGDPFAGLNLHFGTPPAEIQGAGPRQQGSGSAALAEAVALSQRAAPLLMLVRSAVSGDDYDAPMAEALQPRPTARSIGDIVAWQIATRTSDTDEQTVGAYQFVSADIKRLAGSLGVAPDSLFTPEVQDAMATALLEQSGLQDFLAGRLGESDFANEVAKLWSEIPVVTDTEGAEGAAVARGASYYESYGKRPRVTPEQLTASLRALRTRTG